MFLKLLLVIPWIGAGALAYWYMETNGSRLKKYDASLYEEIKNDKDGTKKKALKDDLAKNETMQTENKKKLDELKKKTGDEDDDENKKQIKELEEIIAKKETEIAIAKSADSKLWMPTLTISNLAWTGGIFLVVGLVGHFVTKKILSIFAGDKNSD